MDEATKKKKVGAAIDALYAVCPSIDEWREVMPYLMATALVGLTPEDSAKQLVNLTIMVDQMRAAGNQVT